MRKSLAAVVLLLVAIAALPASAAATTSDGRLEITGKVLRPSGASFIGAEVVLRTPDGKFVSHHEHAGASFYLSAPAGDYYLAIKGGERAGELPAWSLKTDVFALGGDLFGVTVQLPPVAPLIPRVIGHGAPLPGVDMGSPPMSVDTDLGSFDGTITGSPRSETTDSEGRATFLHFDGASAAPGDRGLLYPPKDSGFANDEWDPPVISGPTSFDLPLAGAVELAGVIRAPDGSPLAGKVLSLRNGADAQVAYGTTDADGAFAIHALPGTYTLRAGGTYTPALPSWTLRTDPFALGSDRTGLILQLPPTQPLSVQVLGDGDAPVPGTRVTVPEMSVHADLGDFDATVKASPHPDQIAGPSGVTTFTYFEGSEPIPGKPGNVYPPTASGYAEAQFTPPTISGPTAAVVRPPHSVQLSGTLRYPDGAPVKMTTLHLEVNGEVVKRDETGNTGAFGFVLPPGDYRLVTGGNSKGEIPVPMWTAMTDVFTLDEDLTGAEFELPPTAPFSVRVLGDAGAPLGGARVEVGEMEAPADFGDFEGTVWGNSNSATTAATGVASFLFFDGSVPRPGAGGEVEPPASSGFPVTPFALPPIAGPTEVTVELGDPALEFEPGPGEEPPAGDQAHGDGPTVLTSPAWSGPPATAPASAAVKRTRVDVAFRVRGGHGRGVFRAGFPRARSVSCASSAPVGPWAPAVQAAPLRRRGPGAFTYAWNASAVADGGCAVLQLRFRDGGSREVRFSP